MATRSLITAGLTIPPAVALNTVAAPRRLAAAGAQSLIPLTYGVDRQSALILNVVPKAGDANTLLVQCLWGHALHAVDELRLNDAVLPTGSTVTTYTGSQTTVDPDLDDAFTALAVGYTDTLAGFAYSVVAIPTRQFNGQLNISARLYGRRVYDPRKDSTAGGSGAHRLATPATWEWSDNPSLCLADWLYSTVYGAGEAVLWSSVPAAANANDSLIGSPAETHRLVGVTFGRDGATAAAVGETLRAYAGCWLVPGGAGVRLLPDADAAPAATYHHDDGDIAAIDGLVLRDLGNAPTVVEVMYTDTTQVPWREASAIASLPGAGSTLPWRMSTVNLPGVQRYSQALREATERLNKLNLRDLSFSVEVFDIGIAHEIGDILEVSHPVGLVDKAVRVTDVQMVGPGRWRLQVTEHDPVVYSTDVATAPSVPDTPRDLPAGPLSDVAGFGGVARNGRISWSWAACRDVDYGATEIRDTDADWGEETPEPIFRGKGTIFDQLVYSPGDRTLYARHFGTAGNMSAATASATITVSASDLGVPVVIVEFRDDTGVSYTNP